MEMKIKFKSTLFWSFISKFIWSKNSHWNKTSKQTFQKITYNTVILDFNFLYISEVLTFLDYISSLNEPK